MGLRHARTGGYEYQEIAYLLTVQTAESAPYVAALPYDVQNVAEAREIVAANPRSFLAIDEPVVNFPAGTDPFELPH